MNKRWFLGLRITQLLTESKIRKDHPLYLYLAKTNFAISNALIQEFFPYQPNENRRHCVEFAAVAVRYVALVC